MTGSVAKPVTKTAPLATALSPAVAAAISPTGTSKATVARGSTTSQKPDPIKLAISNVIKKKEQAKPTPKEMQDAIVKRAVKGTD